MFADVSSVADERLQRARDQFYRELGLAPPTSQAVAQEQSAAAQAIRARHVPPAKAELRPPFDQRVTNLVNLRQPERSREWLTEAFPSAKDAMSQVSGDTEKAAALELVGRRLAERTTGVRPYAAQTKIEAYQAARNTLKPDPSKVTRLTQDKKFEARVFAVHLPAYAKQLQTIGEREEAIARAETRQKRINQYSNLVFLCLLVVGAWLPIHLVRRQKFRWRRQSQADWETAMANSPLPKELWWIEVPGFSYPVTLFSGIIYEKEIWTETTTTTTTTTTPVTNHGYGYTSGYTTTSTHVSSTVYHRYWMVTTEGAQTWQKYSDNEFVAAIGHTVSNVWSDNYWVLFSFNHDTGSLSFPAWWTKAMHKPPFGRIVVPTALLSLVVATVGIFAITGFEGVGAEALSGQSGDPVRAVFGLLMFFIPLLLVYTTVVSAIWTARRQGHFRNKVVPRYEAFLRSYHPVIPLPKNNVTKTGS